MKNQKKVTPKTVPPYTTRKPRPKVRFHFRFVFLIFIVCILVGFLYYMFGVNLNFFQS